MASNLAGGLCLGELNVAVFRIGRKSGSWLVGSIDVYIVGRSADGALVGLYTVSVET